MFPHSYRAAKILPLNQNVCYAVHTAALHFSFQRDALLLRRTGMLEESETQRRRRVAAAVALAARTKEVHAEVVATITSAKFAKLMSCELSLV